MSNRVTLEFPNNDDAQEFRRLMEDGTIFVDGEDETEFPDVEVVD